MDIQDLCSDAQSYLAEVGLTDGFRLCNVRNMGISQTQMTTPATCAVIEPLIGLVLQGSKAAQYGTEKVHYNAGDVIVIGHTLPMMSGLINATPQKPYIGLYVRIDLQILRSVFNDMGGTTTDETGRALESGPASPEFIDSMGRMFRLRNDPIAEQTLGDAALREVYFRILTTEQGHALRRLVHADSKVSQVARAISHIQAHYRTPIKASELASISGMSASVFYDAFKRVTANSPLQFQKDLRLTEAHDLLRQTSKPISEVAYTVGYESAAQFSRDFSKKFGAPPKTFAGSAQA